MSFIAVQPKCRKFFAHIVRYGYAIIPLNSDDVWEPSLPESPAPLFMISSGYSAAVAPAVSLPPALRPFVGFGFTFNSGFFFPNPAAFERALREAL